MRSMSHFTIELARRLGDFPTNSPAPASLPSQQIISHSLTPQIEILDLHLCAPGAGRLRAVATVRIGDLTIHGVRVVRNGRRHLVELPDRWDGAGWVPIVSAGAALRVALADVVTEAFKAAALHRGC